MHKSIREAWTYIQENITVDEDSLELIEYAFFTGAFAAYVILSNASQLDRKEGRKILDNMEEELQNFSERI